MADLPEAAEVVVVGGGIVGVATALALSQAGMKPVLLEAGAFGGAVTGGSLAAISNHMHGMAEYDLLAWSAQAWRDLSDSLGSSFEYNPCGQIGFILTEEQVETGEQWVRQENARGAPSELISPQRAAELEPRLTGPLRAATWAPDTATVNPFLAVRALLAVARGEGALAFDRTPVEKLLADDGNITGVQIAGGRLLRTDRVVLACGPWTADLARGLGVDLPLVPRQAQCLASVRQPAGTLRRVISACESAGGVESGYTQIQQSASGQVLFNTVTAAVETPAGAQNAVHEVPPGFVVDSIDTLATLFPSLSRLSLLRSWVRFEAVSPDARFLAGALPVQGLYVCAGDNGSGFCRAPLLGQYMARLVAGTAALPALLAAEAAQLYAPMRFAGEATA